MVGLAKAQFPVVMGNIEGRITDQGWILSQQVIILYFSIYRSLMFMDRCCCSTLINISWRYKTPKENQINAMVMFCTSRLQMTWVDVFVAAYLDVYENYFPGVVAKFPLCEALRGRVQEMPAIKTWRQERPAWHPFEDPEGLVSPEGGS